MTVVKSTALKVYLQVSYDTFRTKMTFESKNLRKCVCHCPSERSSPKLYTHHRCKSTCTVNNEQTSISNIHLYGIWLSKVQCSWLLGMLKYRLWILQMTTPPTFVYVKWNRTQTIETTYSSFLNHATYATERTQRTQANYLRMHATPVTKINARNATQRKSWTRPDRPYHDLCIAINQIHIYAKIH